MFGIDSDYDFDPVWAEVPSRSRSRRPSTSAGSNQALRNSPTNFTYNHIGHFADAGHAAAKGIFLGGVTRRFPELRFAFLEGGVGWGAQLFGDLMEHWERRNIKALENMKPEKLDRDLLMSYVEKYGYKEHAAALRERDGWPDPELHMTGGIDNLDDFARLQVHPQGGLDRPLRQAVLFRLRGGRPDERDRVPASSTRSTPSSTRSTAPISGIST